jgi:ADP-heptose:LPS heptosyltransferase
LISTKSYDAVVDTEQWHLFSAIMAYFTKTSFRIGYSSRDLRTKLFNKTIPYEQHAHELENFQRLFNELQSEPLMINNLNNSFRIPDHLMRWAESQIPYNSITIFLGSSIKLRRLSLGEILKLLQSIHLKGAIPVLLGGRDVAGLSKQIVKTMNGSPVLDFIGKTSLIESAAIIQRSRNFIGPDSGIMHLACSVGTPVVAVFGPGNLNKWGPKGSLHRIVTNNASCSPCTNFGYTIPTCQGSYHCLKDIRIEF